MEPQQSQEDNRPWYVRYKIIPDPKKPRTQVMRMVHSYFYFVFLVWTFIFLVCGIVIILLSGGSADSLLGALAFFAAAYGGFWLLKREKKRDAQRQGQE